MNPLAKLLVVGVTWVTALQFVPLAHSASIPVSNANTVTVLATDPTALIGASSGAFTFIRSGDTSSDLAVPFAYSGTAVLGTDFTDATSSFTAPGPRFVTIPKGFYATDLIIEPKLNPANRGNKTVDVTLDAVALSSTASVGAKHVNAEVRIIDDVFNDKPPTVSLTSPANNSNFPLPATVVLTADASDLDDSVQKVSFYAEDTFLGSATSSPFTFSWVNPKVGNYDLFARAVDAAGKSTLSQPVHITVTGATPTISLTAPQANATVDLHADVPVKVQATGIGDLIVRIVLDGSHLLGELKKAPYELTWTDAALGKHTLTARVTDSVGQTASTSVQVAVTDLPPVVQITSPKDGDNFVAGTDITLTATATDPDDTIKDVTFWANRRVLGKGTPSATDKSVYQFTWVSPKANFYAIQAVATNSNETKSTSAAVVISVSKH